MRREGVALLLADFGNDLSGGDIRYSKGFIKFGCPEPSKMIFEIKIICWLKRHLAFIIKGPSLENFGISDKQDNFPG